VNKSSGFYRLDIRLDSRQALVITTIIPTNHRFFKELPVPRAYSPKPQMFFSVYPEFFHYMRYSDGSEDVDTGLPVVTACEPVG
jgi:hypothetical protein